MATVHGRLPGQGEEFYGHRHYYEGDDLRRVDWNAYRRTRLPYVKETTRGIEGSLAVVVDASGSMCFGEPTRFTLARRAALLLAGAFLEGLRVRVIVAGSRRRDFMGNNLEALTAFLETARADEPGTGSQGLFRGFSDLLYGKGLVVYLGDFYSEMEDVAAGRSLNLGRAPSARAVAARLLVPADMGPDAAGDLEILGIENGDKAMFRWGAAQADKYRLEWVNLAKALREEFLSVGIRMLDVAPGVSAVQTAMNILAQAGFINS
ncbi:MAG: DUF58 domain-containing protein [Planctomycetes bacterium]|nr:DUF58 domain-containing protein [Planctomycetota bacterium]